MNAPVKVITAHALESHPPCLSARRPREESDDYPRVVARLNDRWRVIECAGGIQWVLQRTAGRRHGRPRWDGRSFCCTREALIGCVREHAGEIDGLALAVLLRLPERIGGVA